MLSLVDSILQEENLIGFRDHRQPDHLYLLPESVELKVDAGGKPQFMLLLYAGEAREQSYLTLQFAFRYPEAEVLSALTSDQGEIGHVPFESGSIRISMTVPDVDGDRIVSTSWSDFQVNDDSLSKVTIELDKDDSLILEDLLTDDTAVEPLKAEIEVRYSGFRGAYPATFTFKPDDLFRHCLTELGLSEELITDSSDADIQALPIETVDEIHRNWISQLQSNATIVSAERADDSLVIDEILLRLSQLGWKENDKSLYELQPITSWQGLEAFFTDDEEVTASDFTLTWDLRVPKIDHRSWSGIWNFSGFWHGLDDDTRAELFSKVPVPEPFALVPINVVNCFSFETGEFKKIILKLHYYGASQAWEDHELCLNDVEGVGARNIAVLPDSSPFFYYYAIEAFYHPPVGGGWPLPPVRTGIKESRDPFIYVSPSLLGLHQILLQAQASAFDGIGDIEIRLCEKIDPEEAGHQASVRLNRESPKREVITQKGDTTYYHFYRIIVHPPAGVDAEPVESVAWEPLPQERVLITSYCTQITAPDLIALELSPSETYPADIVLLHLKPSDATDSFEGELIKLDYETPESSWALWRDSLFSELAYKWRSETYFNHDSGIPASISDWQLGKEKKLLFDSLEEDG